MGISSDGGASWNISKQGPLVWSGWLLTFFLTDYGAAAGQYGGSVAYSADADTIVWSTSTKGVLRSQYQGSFTAVSGLPASAVIASDKRDNKYFYGGSGSAFYVSSDTGSTFAKGGAVGSATSIRDIAAHPATAGTVFVSTDAGVFRSTDFGATFAKLGGGDDAVKDTQRIAVGLGAGSSAWNVYAFGDGAAGKKLYATADDGATWVDIQGSQGFGSITACVLAGSANNAGQVYVGTNGRGVFWAQGTIAASGGSARRGVRGRWVPAADH